MTVAYTKNALALAIAIERHNARRFKEWSNRFRTYDKHTSEFLQALVTEESEHEQELVSWFQHLFNAPPPPTSLPTELSAYLAGLDSLTDHFFIVDTGTAQTLLEFALTIERYTRNFYSNLLAQTDDLQLQSLYHRLSDYEAEHEQKFLDQIKTEKNKSRAAMG